MSKALLKGAPKLEMRNKFLYLFTVFMYSIVFASNSKSEFNGTLSILGPNTESNSRTLGLNLRYIPLVKFDISSLCDAEVSGNIFTTFDSNNIVDVTNKLEIKPYRVWLRFATTKFEARIGLQKINFGPARILRSLMWFDQIDPRDPLQFTSGVYGLRMRYDFQNNTNINSTLIFCRARADEFNYSSNPTFRKTDGTVRVIDDVTTDRTFSFITTIGLYDSLNNLLAVAKLSRPVEKNDEKDVTFRIRLDF